MLTLKALVRFIRLLIFAVIPNGGIMECKPCGVRILEQLKGMAKLKGLFAINCGWVRSVGKDFAGRYVLMERLATSRISHAFSRPKRPFDAFSSNAVRCFRFAEAI